ncbi:MAG: D-aminoacyl-tRNA deacylase [Bacteroidota bacterium]
MRVVIQRVKEASVTINQKEIRSIHHGLMILIGITHDDTHEDITWLVQKISKLRIFADHEGVMNLNINDVNGEVLLISQFTLHASTKKGNRPSYIGAAKPDIAIPLYKEFIQQLKKEIQSKVLTGEFGADMQVQLINDGPVTILIDSKYKE